MKTFVRCAIGATLVLGLSTPAMAQKTREMYYIFDIKTDASIDTVSNAIVKGLKKNAPDMQATTHLVRGERPDKPGTFEIIDMSEQMGGNMGGLMALAKAQGGGAMFKSAKCDGAVWTGRFTRDISNQRLNVNTCLFPYKGGYHLDVYANDTNKGHGMDISRKLGGAIAEAIVGKPEKWTQKTFSRMRRKIYEHVGVVPVLVEGQPTIDFSFKDEPVAAPVAEAPAVPPAQAPTPEVVAAPAAPVPTTAPAPTAVTVQAPVAAPAPAPAPEVPAVDCTGLSDEQCMAKLRGE